MKISQLETGRRVRTERGEGVVIAVIEDRWLLVHPDACNSVPYRVDTFTETWDYVSTGGGK